VVVGGFQRKREDGRRLKVRFPLLDLLSSLVFSHNALSSLFLVRDRST
jgi:hypothetical protein